MIQRVLYVCHAKEVGGAELYLADLIQYARQEHGRGELPVEAQLVCRRDVALDGWADRVAQTGVSVHRIDLTTPADYRSLFRLIRRVDLVHLVLAYPTGKYQLAAALLTRAARRPLIITHQLVIRIEDIPMNSRQRAFWRRAFPTYGRLAANNIASSRAGWELLVRTYRFPEAATVLIYNGADVRRFQPLEGTERTEVRRAVAAEVAGESWPDDVLLACTVARLSPQKGLFDLVAAASEVVKRIPMARFLVVGDGPLRGELQARVQADGLAHHVLFAGGRPLTQIASWLGASDLFVLSSLNEGMPLSMVEAMAAGCPVVATAVGGVPDVVADASVGRLVPARDSVALAEAIIEVLGDAELRHRLAAAARSRAVGTFDVRECYARTTGLYRVPGVPRRKA